MIFIMHIQVGYFWDVVSSFAGNVMGYFRISAFLACPYSLFCFLMQFDNASTLPSHASSSLVTCLRFISDSQ